MAVGNEATSNSQNDATSLAARKREVDESDLDPAAFLKSVRELSEKREREDAERFRRLEEEVQKGRQERAARRAERARSISPEKHPLSTPTSNSISRAATNADASLPPISMTPPSHSGRATTTPQRDIANMEPEERPAESVPEFKGFGSIKRSSTSTTTSKANASHSSTLSQNPSEDASAPTTTASGLARSGTLTWNRRPQSVAGPKADSPPAHARKDSADEQQPSRDQIAASLGARDPTWFRQTADRGTGNANAAFRKSHDEDQGSGSLSLGRRRLPGMSRDTTTDPEPQTSPDASESVRSDLMSRGGSVRGSIMSAGSRYSAASSASSGKPDLKALVSEDESQLQASPTYQSSIGSNESSGIARTLAMSTSQARLTNVHDRPRSPTKGMGGFVQSAMMKRTDSQIKRSSVQLGTSLSRQNSATSTRSGQGGLQGSHSMPKLEPSAAIKDSKSDPARPTNSSNDLIKLATEQDKDGFIRPALPSSHSRSKSVASNYSTNDEIPASPGSPSKRFRSPTKSSWIESSLTRPESPKPSIAKKNSQPSWMADLANRNAQRATAEPTPPDADSKLVEDQGSRPASPTKQTPIGPQILKRSDSRDLPTTPGSATPANKLRPLRLADKFEASPLAKAQAAPNEVAHNSDGRTEAETSNDSTKQTTQPPLSSEVKSERLPDASLKESKPAMATPRRDSNKSPAPSVTQTPATPESQLATKRSKSFESPSAPAHDKPRNDTPSKMPSDFRSQLKSRAPPAARSPEQPEFLAKFGQLRKTTTEKYVAPDVLKANILRGKGDLTQTAGPAKTLRRDELKESLLAKKDDMKRAKEEGRDLPGQAHDRKISAEQPKPPSKPEALAKRELLGRSDGARRAAQPDRTREGTPEALAIHKSLRSRESPKTTPKPSPKEFQREFPTPTLDKESTATELNKESSPKAFQKTLSMPTAKKELDVQPTSKPAASATIVEPRLESLSRQTSASGATDAKPAKETSKLVARFNPGLATVLARGPPSQSPSRTETPVAAGQAFLPPENASSDSPAAGAPLNDMRKDRAKGPRRRKGGAKSEAADDTKFAKEANLETKAGSETPKGAIAPRSGASPRPQTPPDDGKLSEAPTKTTAPPGSLASLMTASLSKSPRPLSSGLYGKQEEEEPPATQGSPPARSHQGESLPLNSPPFKRPQGARAFPGSRDSLMKASVDEPRSAEKAVQNSSPASKPPPLKPNKPVAPAKSQESGTNGTSADQRPTIPEVSAGIPEFKGFGASRAQKVVQPDDENKENSDLHSVKAATSLWGRRPSPQKLEAPSKPQLLTKKDEEAAMRSAGLLAASPKPGLGISVEKNGEKPPTPVSAGAPPKPLKSSRSVSGLLAEASPNKGDNSPSPDEPPKTEAGRLLMHYFKQVPRHREPLVLDTSSIISKGDHLTDGEALKTLRRTVFLCFSDGSSKVLAQQHEYTFFDEAVFLCAHTSVNARGSKSVHIYIWAGISAFETTVDAANTHGKRLSRELGSASITVVRQGYEPAALLDAMGGILITRRGSVESAPKQFMLCGRKHLGHIVFDEVDFSIESLCAGFVYLISYPVTLQQTKLYLWKGSACSTEELSGARLAAMDLSETGEIIEVDGGVEFPSFLKIFGAHTTKRNVLKPSGLWQQKATAPDKFHTRLFKISQAEPPSGLFSAIWSRRPSWNSLSPARSPSTPKDEVKIDAKEITPFSQAQLEAEGLYLLDGYSELYVLMGPLFTSQPEHIRSAILGQTLLFASDYAILAASMEDRCTIPKCWVLFSGVPRDVKMMFRHWDEGRGLWGTASLMAGEKASAGREVNALALEEVLNEVCNPS